jgi:drug/metabolite transporter (DMT)-like permease
VIYLWCLVLHVNTYLCLKGCGMAQQIHEGTTIGLENGKQGRHMRGLLYAVCGAALWGLSGTAAQALFQTYHVAAQWLVTVRMLGSGILLLCWFRPTFPRQLRGRFVLFAIVGLAGVQFAYFAAIAYSNVATATCMQYPYLPMIALYELVVQRKAVTRGKLAALVTALLGVFLLVLGGQNGHIALQITPLALALGVLSAILAAYYMIASKYFVTVSGVGPVTTWGFLIGGAAMAIVAPPWNVQVSGNMLLFVALVVFVVLFGTLLAFGLTFSSLTYVSPMEASIVITVEPITAALALLIFFHVPLLLQQYFGGICILLAVMILSLEGKRATTQ